MSDDEVAAMFLREPRPKRGCPFCHSPRVGLMTWGGDWFSVHCAVCRAEGSQRQSKEEALRLWDEAGHKPPQPLTLAVVRRWMRMAALDRVRAQRVMP